jgi:Ca-activated chloride channel family protein
VAAVNSVLAVVTGVSFLPVGPWPLLLLLTALGGVLVWSPAGRRERVETLTTRLRRSAMVALVLLAALRPAVPGTDIRVDASALDVYFVVDTTSSIMARDYAGGTSRLTGVRADLRGVAQQLPGARFSVMTFDVDTTTRLPLTSDAAALASAADTLRAETTNFSRGSSVTLARDAVQQALQRGRESHPERPRVVFYLGDGEQTASSSPPPFTLEGDLVNGGAVLGYGTAAGGPMLSTGDRTSGDILDPATNRPALSHIDEKELRAIADQLGLPYVHRTAPDEGVGIVDAVQLRSMAPVRAADSTGTVSGRTELYWVALLLLSLVAAWELGAATAAAAATRAGSAVPPPGTPTRRRLVGRGSP